MVAQTGDVVTTAGAERVSPICRLSERDGARMSAARARADTTAYRRYPVAVSPAKLLPYLLRRLAFARDFYLAVGGDELER